VERAWILLWKVYQEGEDPRRVTEALRRFGKERPEWMVPPLPAGKPERGSSVTIASLGSFGAGTYAEKLDEWCRAALGARIEPGGG
jgi:hypothetical protein